MIDMDAYAACPVGYEGWRCVLRRRPRRGAGRGFRRRRARPPFCVFRTGDGGGG
ncbi:MAG: hypothetical protein R2705_09480 [Ilumatobacteraceae bacterium]